MPNWKKIFLGTGVGAGLIAIIHYVSSLKRTGDQLEAVTTAKIHSLKMDGLTVRVDVVLKNPTSSALKIKFPFVKILYKDKTIGTSQVVNKDIEIPTYGEARIQNILIKMPITGLLSLGSGMYNLITKKTPAPIFVKTISTIDLGWKKVPYEKTDDMTLNPKITA